MQQIMERIGLGIFIVGMVYFGLGVLSHWGRRRARGAPRIIGLRRRRRPVVINYVEPAVPRLEAPLVLPAGFGWDPSVGLYPLSPPPPPSPGVSVFDSVQDEVR